MKTLSASRPQIAQPQSVIPKSGAVKNLTSSKTIKQTSKTRNFGWLVKGMVEACHQISIDELNQESGRLYLTCLHTAIIWLINKNKTQLSI